MCLAIPGQIIAIDKGWAVVDIMGIENIVNVQLIESPKIGDYMLIHAGCAIEKINTEYFSYLETVFTELMDKGNKDG